VKDEAWWLVLGNTSTSELYALKRVSFTDHLVTHMKLPSALTDMQVQMNILPSLAKQFVSLSYAEKFLSFQVDVLQCQ